MLGDFAGGLVIVIIAAVIGIAQNAVRSNPVKLIQNTRPVSTASHDAGETASGVTPEVDAAHPADGQTTPAVAEESLPEGSVSLERARQLYDEGVSIFIDARSPESFAEGHIPGAVNIPYDQLPKYLDTLQSQVLTSDHIICYCWSPTCDFSDQLATELKIMGYDNVEVFTGGWDQWIEAGHPTEEGE
jgi:rhodanese-related sulfurtransferase